MSSQLVKPKFTLSTVELNAWVADNFTNIEILFYFFYYNVITLNVKKSHTTLFIT